MRGVEHATVRSRMRAGIGAPIEFVVHPDVDSVPLEVFVVDICDSGK